MGGSEGYSAANKVATPKSLETSGKRSDLLGIPGVQDIMSKYGQGGMSLSDALSSAKGLQSDPNSAKRKSMQDQIAALKGQGAGDRDSFKRNQSKIADLENQLQSLPGQESADTSGLSDMLATGAGTAGQFAREQLDKSDFYGGQKHAFDEAGKNTDKYNANADIDREAMSGKDPSYGMNTNDYAAYGQASGDLARMYGGQEQGLAQSLADRGLGAAPSGAAAQQFSGLLGNKYEQLAKAQTDIAQKRIDVARDQVNKRAQQNLDLLKGSQGVTSDMGKQMAAEQNSQIANQMGARTANENQLSNQTKQEQEQQGLAQNQANEAMAQQQSTEKEGLGSTLAKGALGAVGTGLAGALTGGVAPALGAIGKGASSLYNNIAGGGSQGGGGRGGAMMGQ